MNNKEKLNNLKNKYLELRELVILYNNALNYNDELDLKNQKENVKTKRLVLTKPFYGKNLIVG